MEVGDACVQGRIGWGHRGGAGAVETAIGEESQPSRRRARPARARGWCASGIAPSDVRFAGVRMSGDGSGVHRHRLQRNIGDRHMVRPGSDSVHLREHHSKGQRQYNCDSERSLLPSAVRRRRWQRLDRGQQCRGLHLPRLPELSERGDGGNRSHGSNRCDRGDRSSRGERSSRGDRCSRGDRSPGSHRSNRTSRRDRRDGSGREHGSGRLPGSNRGDRSDREHRSRRSNRGDRSDREHRSRRNNRGGRSSREQWCNRPSGRDRGNGSDRERRSRRNNRGGGSNRPRGSHGSHRSHG